ncbi:hypothetical protein [Limimaricola cinnabarinus]|uniref:Uncharacterized protein n=1 Tax=Limimaricola cinnabarinus TaxID=1125964 RepID=A0A2G1MDT6_9RHOB|nr:hypothetical protein [Limimaricola cinnabarinus]PHP26830.1 hypothetical protein CJ301_14050 [Limimaricola cinnabarinus]
MDDIEYNKLTAEDRAAIRKQMWDLQQLSTEWELDCLGLQSLMRHFGALIAREVEVGLVVSPRDQHLYPVILGAVAKWAEELSMEYSEPEERAAAEVLEVVKHAAVHARNVIEAFEQKRAS